MHLLPFACLCDVSVDKLGEDICGSLFSVCFISCWIQRWEITKQYFVTILYLSIFFLDNFLLFLSSFEYKYLNFLPVIFPKQTRFLSLNAFFFLAALRTLYQPKILLFVILEMRPNNQLIFWCV